MDEEVVKKYLRAGEIAYRVKQNIVNYLRPGIKLLDLANSIEGMIKDLGAQPAFPVNISINSIAAHKTPLPDEVEPTIRDNDVVKVDIGVHIDGYIADTAITLCYDDRFDLLVEGAREALDKSLSNIREGVRFSSIGSIIEDTAKRYGFKSVRNLGGHSLGRYLIHAGDVIPNYNDISQFGRFRRGEAYAIEPFVSNGKGYVIELDEVNIYALAKTKFKNLTSHELQLVNYIMERFKTLPFCERWLVKDIGLSINDLRLILNSLTSKNVIRKYPILQEALSSAYVAQFEETVLISEGVLITTNPKL
ncbi:MAG: type II methionyl aminopeptidase [Sulfolobales archaeon]